MKTSSIFQQNCKEVLSSPSRSAITSLKSATESPPPSYFLSSNSASQSSPSHSMKVSIPIQEQKPQPLYQSSSERTLPSVGAILASKHMPNSPSLTNSPTSTTTFDANTKKSIFSQQHRKPRNLTNNTDIIDWVSGNSTLSFEEIMNPTSSSFQSTTNIFTQSRDHLMLHKPTSLRVIDSPSNSNRYAQHIDFMQSSLPDKHALHGTDSNTANEMDISTSSTRRSRRKQFAPESTENSQDTSGITDQLLPPPNLLRPPKEKGNQYNPSAFNHHHNLSSSAIIASTHPHSETHIQSIYEQFLKHTTKENKSTTPILRPSDSTSAYSVLIKAPSPTSMSSSKTTAPITSKPFSSAEKLTVNYSSSSNIHNTIGIDNNGNSDDDDDYYVPRQKSNTADMTNPSMIYSTSSVNTSFQTTKATSLYKSILKNPNPLENNNNRSREHSNASRSSSQKRVQFAATHTN